MRKDNTFRTVLLTIEKLTKIIKQRDWEMIQLPIVSKPATEHEIKTIELSIGRKIPGDLRALFKYSKTLKFCYQYDEDSASEFKEVKSGEIAWDLDDLVSLYKYYEHWIYASTDLKYNDDESVMITKARGVNKFPFMRVTNGDFIIMDKDPSEIIYLSHEGDEMHGKALAKNLWSFLELQCRTGFVGPEGWQFEPFYHTLHGVHRINEVRVDTYGTWLFQQP